MTVIVAKTSQTRVVEDIKQIGGEAHTVQAGVSNSQDAEKLITETVNHFELDIIINNAELQETAPSKN